MNLDTYGHISETMPAVLRDIRARKGRGGRIAGLSTGLPKFDDLIDGLNPASLYIFGARPKQGKTALALCIARHIVIHGHTAAFFSMEMPKQQLIKRLIAIESGVPFRTVHRATYGEDEGDQIETAATDIEHWPLIIDDETALTPSQLEERAKRAVEENGAKVIFLDYLQRMRPDRVYKSRYEQVTAISEAVADLRKKLNVSIVALAQLSRRTLQRSNSHDWKKFSAESSRPTDEDLRDSGQLEQDGDVICFINRPEIYLQAAKPSDADTNIDYEHALTKWRGRAELFVQHNRAGESGFVNLRFNGPLMKFEEARQ
jgi:replicative DNA helicase